MKRRRCLWAGENDPLMIAYHDKEWGVPVRNDRKIFEFLVLESAQAGLNWRMILNKRKNYEKAFKLARLGTLRIWSLKRKIRELQERIKEMIKKAQR